MTDIPEFGQKEFDGVGFPTPSSIPDETACRTLEIPANGAWEAVVMGALFALTLPENWQQLEGGISRDDAAERAFEMIDDCYALVETNQCGVSVPAPFWDDEDGADADDEEPVGDQEWYGVLVGESTFQEQLEDWAIAAFVAIAATPAAAIAFLTIAPKFRLAFKTANWGAIVKIFIDASEYGTVDTYAVEPGIVTYDVFAPSGMGAMSGAHELWIEHTGEHNEAATPDPNGNYTIQVIRKQLNPEELAVSTELRQSEDEPCVLEYSIDGGETWLTAFDYSLCAAPNQAPPDVIIVNPGAPDDTFVSQEGDTDEQKQARADGLCFASNYVVQTLMGAAYQVCNGQATSFNIAGVVLGLVTAVLIAVTIISAGSLTALAMLAITALLEIYGQVSALNCNVYLDEDVRDALICMVYKNLMNQPVTIAGFSHAFDHPCDDGDVSDVADVFASMLQSPAYKQRIFDGFLNVLGEAQSAALQGATVASCICEAETWSYMQDFKAMGKGIWSETTDHIYPGGYTASPFVVGCGFQNTSTSFYFNDCDQTIPANGAACAADIFIPEGTTITKIRMVVEAAYPNAGTAWYADSQCNELGNATPEWVFPTPLGAGTHHLWVFVWDNTAASNPRRIRGIYLEGEGNNPLAACDSVFDDSLGSC